MLANDTHHVATYRNRVVKRLEYAVATMLQYIAFKRCERFAEALPLTEKRPLRYVSVPCSSKFLLA